MAEDVPDGLVRSLADQAREIRKDIIRMTRSAGSGHPGGSLSVTDLLTALVFRELRIDPGHPDDPDRDRLILSRGPAVPALYAALAHRGYLPVEELLTLRYPDSRFDGDVDRPHWPGVEVWTGGPAQGLGIAVGMALDARLAGRPSRVYVVIGYGECRAGSTWEALLAGGYYRLSNLVVILVRNRPETDGPTEPTLGVEPIAEKLRAFRYRTVEIDGHDLPAILRAFAEARSTAEGPSAIVARTVPGKGVSFLEGQPTRHGNAPTLAETEKALAELSAPAPGGAA